MIPTDLLAPWGIWTMLLLLAGTGLYPAGRVNWPSALAALCLLTLAAQYPRELLQAPTAPELRPLLLLAALLCLLGLWTPQRSPTHITPTDKGPTDEP